jgi:Secretion system C-terminal sorting domain
MKKILFFLFLLYGQLGHAQTNYTQRFDGADTTYGQATFVFIDSGANNIWQIGPPQKIIFDSAKTLPKALLTDTINSYPDTNTSKVSFGYIPFISFGVGAHRWVQKLDIDSGDIGLVQYSTDSGQTWINAFNNPFVYNFYGFDSSNKDTLSSGLVGFSGKDTTWKDIWLCFSNSYVNQFDSLALRFVFMSDSIPNTNHEGWMIDNLMAHVTILHTAMTIESQEYLNVFPTRTDGIVHIEAQKLNQFHIIEKLEVFNQAGERVMEYKNVPTKFYIDLSALANGFYFLKIKTNIKQQTFKIIKK